MNHKIIDISFIAAKVAALKDERARIAVAAMSLIYNTTEVARFQIMAASYAELLSIITFRAKLYGYATTEDINLAQECKKGIQFCQKQIHKYGIIAATDIASLIFDAINGLAKK